MPRPAPKFIWEKLVTPAWLTANDSALQRATRGEHAVVEIPKRARLRIEYFADNRGLAESLQHRFGGKIRRLPLDWQQTWFSAHRTKPLRIGNRLIVSGEKQAAVADTLVIPASTAFGTGEHATTAMSLRLLEQVTRRRAEGWRMLDAGTGSGILALAGCRFGAGAVLAIDNDPLALKTARWNARENGIRGVEFRVGDVRRGLGGRFEVIAANLFSELLIAVLPKFARALRDGGHLILSGVLREQEPALQRALRANGFRIEMARRRGRWVALLAAAKT